MSPDRTREATGCSSPGRISSMPQRWSSLLHATPTLRQRVSVAALIGLASIAYVLLVAHFQPPGAAADFDIWWVCARAWLSGQDPYLTVSAAGWQWPLYYPMTTIIAVTPLTSLPVPVARAIFGGVGAGLLAFACTNRAWWPLTMFTSGAFLTTLYVGQWGAWLMAAALIPWLGALLACKPTLGLALGTYAPSWRAVVGAVLALAASVVLYPPWPREWLHAISMAPQVVAPVTRPGGFILLLALLRWRRPEARLLLALSCVPHTILPHEALPLFLIPQSYRESALLSLSTLVLAPIIAVWAPTDNWAHALAWSWPFMFLLAYFPALAMVLQRPNEGRSASEAT
jgi:hypothetical protein